MGRGNDALRALSEAELRCHHAGAIGLPEGRQTGDAKQQARCTERNRVVALGFYVRPEPHGEAREVTTLPEYGQSWRRSDPIVGESRRIQKLGRVVRRSGRSAW